MAGDRDGRDWPTVGAMVRGRRIERRLTLQRLAEMAGITKSYLWLIERDRRPPPGQEVLARLERALGFCRGELHEAARWQATPGEVRREVQHLRGTERVARRLAEILADSGVDESGRVRGALDRAYRSGELRRLIEAVNPSSGDVRGDDADVARVLPLQVPLINSVAAGYPTDFTDLGYPARVADEYVRCPDVQDPDAFAARVVGDSMLPEYREGDIVIFSPAREVRSGMDCFARLEPDHESTFKRVYIEADDQGREMIRLQPLNPAYPPRVVPREQVAGLYPAVAVTRMIG